jgi:carbamoyltransferase
MYILGLNISGFHSSAALIRVSNGEVLAAITEERLTRVKSDKSFPNRAIEFCLRFVQADWSSIAKVVVGWNPKFYQYSARHGYEIALSNRQNIPNYVYTNLYKMIDKGNENHELTLAIKNSISFLNKSDLDIDVQIEFVDHHDAHFANAYVQSGFKETDILILDGFGEISTGYFANLTNGQLNKISEFNTPHSIGMFYSAFTEFLGFKPNGDEWKVMALASLGNPMKYYDKIRKLIKLDNQVLEIDLSFFEFYLSFRNSYLSKKFIMEFGPKLKQGEALTDYHYDVVASLQRVVEDLVFEFLKIQQQKSKSKSLIVGGGFFMNSVLNGKLIKYSGYEVVYVGGTPDDTGISVGSALYTYFKMGQCKGGNPQILQNYWGSAYDDFQIRTYLDKIKIQYSFVEENVLYELIAQEIKMGKIVGWFQGRSEFGQRALGNRSILADPTNESIKDLVNSSIKYREGFRPFAPSILEEFQADYFEFEQGESSFFMERVFPFKEKYRKSLPGVVHFDGTGRIQTVSNKVNPRYYELISAFYKISGHPVLLNTSFNINGMPLVESPEDAIDCFYRSGIDILVLGNCVIYK